MIQLSYQPAFDPYHNVYRLLRLRAAIAAPLPKDKLRILDFYLLHPFRIGSLRLKQNHRRFRRLASKYAGEKPYGDLPDDKTLLARMSPIQTVALDTLASRNLIEASQYRQGTVVATDVNLPASLEEGINRDNEAQSDLLEFLLTVSSQYELLGFDGLKHRSGLMEYRYDAI